MTQVIFMGPPGAGKGTQCLRIAKEYNVAHVSSGDIFRKNIKEQTELGLEAASFINRGKLVPDNVTIKMIEARIAEEDCKNGFLLDGFPRTVTQAVALDEMLAELRMPLDVVINLEVPDQIVAERLIERGKKEGRTDDTPETIKTRLDTFHNETAPVIEYYGDKGCLAQVDGVGEMDVIFDRIKTQIDTRVKKVALL